MLCSHTHTINRIWRIAPNVAKKNRGLTKTIELEEVSAELATLVIPSPNFERQIF
jgi:hypothetical protein